MLLPEFIGFPIISRTISTPTTVPIRIPAAVIFLSAVNNILLNVLLLIFLAALKSVLPEICSAPWNVSVPTVSDIPQPIVPAIKNRPALPATEKFLFEREDGNRIESVLMIYNYGNSVCISSQVGCRMVCRFCASTLDGLERNLTTSEMLRQLNQIQKLTG